MDLNQVADWLIMIIAGALIAVWLLRRFYHWLHEPPASRMFLLGPGGELADDDENIRYLEQSGYEVISGKHRVPISIGLDGEPLSTRLFIDYVAMKDGKTYMVKTARDRMPLDWTGSGVRDRLLVYALLVPGAAGILYMDAKERWIRTITFAIGSEPIRGDKT
jgi:hypothetical protein